MPSNLIHMALDSILIGESIETVVERILLVESKAWKKNIGSSGAIGFGDNQSMKSLLSEREKSQKKTLTEVNLPTEIWVTLNIFRPSTNSLKLLELYPWKQDTMKKLLKKLHMPFLEFGKGHGEDAILWKVRTRREATYQVNRLRLYIMAKIGKPGNISLGAVEWHESPLDSIGGPIGAPWELNVDI